MASNWRQLKVFTTAVQWQARRATVMDRTQWKDLKEFVIDVIGHFATDNRILFWDLYNEPGNRMIFEKMPVENMILRLKRTVWLS